MQKFTSVTEELATMLKAGKVLLYPTDTCLGLGCVAGSVEGVKNLAEIKNRDVNKPLSLFVDGIDMAKRYVQFTELAENLWKTYLPGELTLILPKLNSSDVDSLACNQNVESLGLRLVAADLNLSKLITMLGAPLTTTSANVSGKDVCIDVGAAMNIFEDKDLLYLEDEVLNFSGTASTVVEVTLEDRLIIYREGRLAKELNEKFAAYIK